MNLGEMCMAAARWSDRYDEYVKTVGEDGQARYEGEALNWFRLFRDAVNEAYFDIARAIREPRGEAECRLGEDRRIDLTDVEEQTLTLVGVYRADGGTEIPFAFITRDEIEVTGAKAGETVVLRYHQLPDRLEKERDEPVFSEATADPAIYICLATARVWQSERKLSAAQYWMNEYYRRLRALRSGMKTARMRRLPARPFR